MPPFTSPPEPPCEAVEECVEELEEYVEVVSENIQWKKLRKNAVITVALLALAVIFPPVLGLVLS